MLEDVVKTKGVQYRIVAIDPNESRRAKMEKVAVAIGALPDCFKVADISQAKQIVDAWTGAVGCNAILEVREHKVPACISTRRMLTIC